ncbi:MAG: 2TM domain-containing protein [Candidatus Kapabacteria bacterium]|nr:2TM domain-containing protein [Candidatus Kapabacteria bacterium]
MSDHSMKFSHEQMQDILRLAMNKLPLKEGGQYTYEEIVMTAAELGISIEQIELALEEYAAVSEYDEAKEQYLEEKKDSFRGFARTYGIVNALLFILDVAIINGFTGWDWSYYVMFGMGFPLAFKYMEAFFPKKKDIENGARKLVEKWKKDRVKREEELRRRQLRKEGKDSVFSVNKIGKGYQIRIGNNIIDI